MTYQQKQQHFSTDARSVGPDTDLERYIAKGRLLRAQAVAALLTAGAKRVASLLHAGVSASIEFGRRTISWLAREHQRRVSLRALMALDDHMLKDIGLSRSEVHAMVDGVFRTPEAGQSREQTKALTLVVNKHSGCNDDVKRAA